MLNSDRLTVPTLDELKALPKAEVQDLFHRELLRSPHSETMEQWLQLGRSPLDSAGAGVQFEQGIQIVQENKHAAVRASLLTNHGLALDRLGQSARAIEQHLGSIAIRERLGHHRGLASSCFNLGELYARRGDDDVAYEYDLCVRDLQEQLDDVDSVARTFSSIAIVLAHTGQVEEALRYQQDAENLVSNVPDARLHGLLMMIRSSILKNIGRIADVTGQLQVCAAFARENGLQEMEVPAAVSVAKEHAALGDQDKAIATFEYALGRSKDMGLRWLEGAPDLLLSPLHIFRTNQSFDDYLSTLIDLANVYKSLHATADAFDALVLWESEFRSESSRQLVDRINDIRQLQRHERTVLEAESIAAHDLKNPLGLVRSMLQTIMKHAETLPREDVIDLCKDMYTSVEPMQSLEYTFLDMSRSADDPTGLRLVDINVGAIIMRTAFRYVQSATRKNITLELPEYVEVTAHADPAALEEIIDNLLSNAIKFCDAGATISVFVRQDDGAVYVHVHYDGPGLSEEDKQNLFTKDGRLTPKPTAGEDSNGLGLYLSLRLAERMSGTITCESTLGSGCDFQICLPVGRTT